MRLELSAGEESIYTHLEVMPRCWTAFILDVYSRVLWCWILMAAAMQAGRWHSRRLSD